ncbi:unnamed protein product [Haemonchus placei]|uniref:CACTA en-spm transposon protein n=1 Tax=Haemonchus placei TaxID=6290 RepID=A0A0N4X1R3_HAEPC|nr:unnamed protein product [Haemonchus placei]
MMMEHTVQDFCAEYFSETPNKAHSVLSMRTSSPKKRELTEEGAGTKELSVEELITESVVMRRFQQTIQRWERHLCILGPIVHPSRS